MTAPKSASVVERVLAAADVLLAHHDHGHHSGCLAVVGSGRCDCGFDGAMADLALETAALRVFHREKERHAEVRRIAADLKKAEADKDREASRRIMGRAGERQRG